MFKKNIFLYLTFLISLCLLSSLVFATDYGSGRYGFGTYGNGEEDHRAGGGGAGGGGAGGGSRSSASVSDGGEAVINLQVPNDLENDVAESSFTLSCLSDRCTVTANEISDLPSEVSAVYEGYGEFIAAVRLQCVGDVGSSTASINVDSSACANCEGLRVSRVSDDGSAEDSSVDCNDNEDSSLDVTATFSGCDYLVVWQEFGEEVRPTTDTGAFDVETEGAGVQVEEVQSAEGAGGLWLLVGLLVVVVLVIVIVALKKRRGKKKF